ncbi:MAG: hypothetical protein ACE5F1_06220 [Planctomycetota bacterium]
MRPKTTSFFLLSLLSFLALLLLAAPARPQCAGQGDAVLALQSIGNAGNRPGDRLLLRILAAPNSHVCFLWDTGPGPTRVPGIGTICLDLSSNLIVFPLLVGAPGLAEFSAIIPQGLQGRLVSAQWLGLAPDRRMVVSNGVSLRFGETCKGGVRELSLLTSFANPIPSPATILAEARDKYGKPLGRTSFTYTRKDPPKLPFTSDGIVYVDKVAHAGGRLSVLMRVLASTLARSKLPANTLFSVSVGSRTHSQLIHSSCSKPLAVGFAFGEFTVTGLR